MKKINLLLFLVGFSAVTFASDDLFDREIILSQTLLKVAIDLNKIEKLPAKEQVQVKINSAHSLVLNYGRESSKDSAKVLVEISHEHENLDYLYKIFCCCLPRFREKNADFYLNNVLKHINDKQTKEKQS